MTFRVTAVHLIEAGESTRLRADIAAEEPSQRVFPSHMLFPGGVYGAIELGPVSKHLAALLRSGADLRLCSAGAKAGSCSYDDDRAERRKDMY